MVECKLVHIAVRVGGRVQALLDHDTPGNTANRDAAETIAEGLRNRGRSARVTTIKPHLPYVDGEGQPRIHGEPITIRNSQGAIGDGKTH